MQNIIYLFHKITKIKIAKLICIKLIDIKYKCRSKNVIDLKKILIICNTSEYFGIIVKSNTVFMISNKKYVIK